MSKIKILLFSIILFSIILSSNSSIIDKKNIAKTYYESDLYEDAIIILEEVLDLEKNIFSNNSIHLLETITTLYELNYFVGNFDASKLYLQEYINIQSSFILQQQNLFTKPLTALKEIYINEKKSEFINHIDSLLIIINSNSNILYNDSTFILPKLLVNKHPNDKIDTELSINDIALEQIKNGIMFLQNNLYTEAIFSLTEAIAYQAGDLDINYFKKLNFGQEKENLYNNLFDNISSGKDTINTKIYFYLGLIDYQNQKFDASIKHFKTYNKYHPKDINSLIFAGDIFFQNKEWLDATFYFFRALKLNPNNLYANLYLAKSLNKIEDYEESNNILKYILSKNTNNYDVIYNLGYNYFHIGKYEQAIKFLTQSILLDTSQFENYYYLGLSYLKKGLNKQGLDAFKKCIAINTNHGLAHYELGKLYTLILKEDLAISHFEIAKKYENIDDLNYRLGLLYYKNELYIKAMEPLKNYLINNLNDINILEIIGEIFIRTKRFPEAIDIYSRLIDENPVNELYYLEIANAYYQLEDLENTIQNYKKAIELNEENSNTYIKIGTALNKQNFFSEAENFLKSALDCGSENKKILMQLGISYGGQGKFLQSLLAFQNALKFSLEDPIIHYQLGIIYKELDIYDLAIDNFNFYLNKNTNDEIAFFIIGECYFNQGNYKEAITYFKKTLNSKNMQSLYKIGESYLRLNDNKNAAKYFKNVIKTNPDHIKSRVKLINLYIELNKSREAKKECEIIYMLDRSVYNSINFCIAR